MKNILLILTLTLFATSCIKEKDYTCQCTFTHVEAAKTTINVESYPVTYKHEETATVNCEALNNRYSNFNTTGDCVLLK